jgi:hypothetical protein
MKRVLIATVTVLLILSNLLCFETAAAVKVPTAEDMGGYENLCLTYTFRYAASDNGRHYEQDLMPYTAYLDKNGKIKDFFFDSYLFLPCMGYGPSGARMHLQEGNPTKAIDWTAYVDDTFYSKANVDALESAFGKTKAALNDTKSKAGVFFTLLYPSTEATNFGNLGGKNLNFSKLEDRKYALKWMIDEQIKRFEQKGYKHLDLVGFYWLEEFTAASGDGELLKYASDYLHSKGLKFIWIPWYKANDYEKWQSYGFDVACMQPNLMWLGYHDPNRVEDSVKLSEKYGLCMEMECDGRVYTDEYFGRYLSYLEGGMNSSMMDAVKMYYQDGKTAVYYKACYSKDPQFRMVYDLTYKYAKGTLTQADIDPVRPEQVSNDYEVVSDIKLSELKAKNVDWISIGKRYSGCRSYVDGNGADYQKVDGKELTDGILATKALSTDWHAFHHSITDAQGKMSVTVDLGEIRNDLTHFYAHFDNRMIAGIGSPAGIVISVSNDGKNFRELARPKLILDSTNSCFKYVTEPVMARYVKMSCGGMGGAFVFCSEFLIGVKNGTSVDESTPDESSKPTETSKDESKPEESSKPTETSKDESKPEESKGNDDITDNSSKNENTESNTTPESSVSSESVDASQDVNASTESEYPVSGEASQPTAEDDGNGVLVLVVVGVAAIAVIAVIIVIIKKKK